MWLSQAGPRPASYQPGFEPCLAQAWELPGLQGSRPPGLFPCLRLARPLIGAAQPLLIPWPGPLMGLACGCWKKHKRFAPRKKSKQTFPIPKSWEGPAELLPRVRHELEGQLTSVFPPQAVRGVRKVHVGGAGR